MRPFQLVGLVGLVGVGAGVSAIGSGTSDIPTPPSRPECPTHQIHLDRFRKHGGQGGFATSIPLSDNIATIPEFHDCQRLLVKGKNHPMEYGPLVAIFARKNLDSLPEHSSDDGVALATIYSYDGAYPPLGIDEGFHCLYLFRRSGVPRYFGRMVPSPHERCRPTIPLSVAGTDLRVIDTSSTAITNSPPVARWDWTDGFQLQSITIRCGPKAWCDIGPRQGWSKDAGISTTFFGTAMQERFTVRGWHDRQYLAPPDGLDATYQQLPPGADAGNTWVAPSPIIGTVVPRPGIERIMDFSAWKQIAAVYLSAPPQQYLAKYGFAEAQLEGQPNILALCKGTGCNGSSSTTSIDGSASCTRARQIRDRENLPADAIWYAMVTQPNGKTMTMCAVHREHKGVDIPGTMRWRWMADDEGIWAPCMYGCCQVLGGGF